MIILRDEQGKKVNLWLESKVVSSASAHVRVSRGNSLCGARSRLALWLMQMHSEQLGVQASCKRLVHVNMAVSLVDPLMINPYAP